MYKDLILQKQRRQELINIYREVAPGCWSQTQACEKVVNHEASCFFLTPHAAYNALRKVFYGTEDDINVVKPNDKRKYTEILKRVVALSKTPEHSHLNLRQLCEIVVSQKAPEFYLEPRTFSRILVRERKEQLSRLRNESRRKSQNC